MHIISVNKHIDYSAPIMFVPLGVQTQTTTKQLPVTRQKKIAPEEKLVETKITPAAPQKPSIAAPVQKKEEKKQTTLQPIQQEKKETKESVKEKPVEAVTKEKVKPIEQPVQTTPITKTPQPQPITHPIQENTTEKIANSAMHIPENARTSHNHREVEALRRGAQLQKELVQKWHPPIGVSPDCTCDISFFVNKQGNIEQLKMVKSSGVVMFDISARQALCTMKMPPWTHGKPLIINFKQ
jgi:hypothetical protein